ncbi:alkaline phosphatase D family protein [Octadecabacter ascidiaceicola]|uniref:Phospholipase D n=1 Tax=Octadecabacter ascidiaceicola TaxID=1655543 RepID=A0A238JTH7_9RHOB|nr:alkaline phosphatase D family protein [Octadecabacter ascidiaceicola]SMX33961.1 Phospholipase D precursor [Octadecabacter ascidiaceicola]
MISRRKLLTATLAASTSVAALGAYEFWPLPSGQSFTSSDTAGSGVFAHGVASGDPLHDRVVLWTHVDANDAVDVQWEVSQTADFKSLFATGVVATSAARDWTVKVDVSGLTAGTQFFYRFKLGDNTSEVGRTKTLPVGPIADARFAVVSCSSWQHGYFNVYDHIARQDHFDAMIHLGDYIYEYGTSEKAGQPKAGPIRPHAPTHETITLADYRMRLAQYRQDASLRAVTARIPLIAIWDDHETANDSYTTGAANHQSDEGNWPDRQAAALQAYYEWLPVREPSGDSVTAYRSYEWGDLATLVAVETRLIARNAPITVEDASDALGDGEGLDAFNENILFAEDREVLGQAQQDFVVDAFTQSKRAGKPWRILANQVVMGRVATPDLRPHVTKEAMDNIRPKWAGIDEFVRISGFRLPFDLNSWDGYPAARTRLYDALDAAGINDMLVLTGDAHEYWVNDLTADDGSKMGVEIGTTSVTSSTLQSFLGDSTASYALLMTRENPDVRYYNPVYHGYVDLHLMTNAAVADLVAVDTVFTRDYTAFSTAKFKVSSDHQSLAFGRPRGLNPKQWALFRSLG